jgi:hypothetical protein
MFDKRRTFERKLQLWELQLQSNNKTPFLILKKEKPTDAKKCVEEIQLPQQEFNSHF